MSMNLFIHVPNTPDSDRMENFGVLRPRLMQTTTADTYRVMGLPPNVRLSAYLKLCEHALWYEEHARELRRWAKFAELSGRQIEFGIE